MRTLIALVLLAFATACNDATGLDNSYVGTYTLRSIDGDAVPITVYDDGTEYARITGGTLIFNDDQTFTTSLDINYGIDGREQNESEWIGGTFTRSGRSFTLTDGLGDSYVATWNGSDTMTINDEGVVIVFRR